MAAVGRLFSFGQVEVYTNDVLGVGSYGKVCKAKCGQLPCAAKLLHDTMIQPGDPGVHKYMEKFEQECQFLSSLKHPNIVQCLASVRVSKSNMPALLMELMDESLTKFLEQSPGALPYHTQVGICHDVALALAYLHSNAIIHRDLSSNNVLVIGAGVKAKVTDFGMSKIVDTNPRMTPLTQCPGALVYMPPEALITPPQYSDKLDCFSHGVLAIQIITRNFPSPGDAHKHVEDSKYPNEHLLRQVPETERRKKDIDSIEDDHTLLPIALDCLKNKSSDRPSADDLCRRLSALEGEQRHVLSLEQKRNEVQRLKCIVEERDELIGCCRDSIKGLEIEKGELQTRVKLLEEDMESKNAEIQALRKELQGTTQKIEEERFSVEQQKYQNRENQCENEFRISKQQFAMKWNVIDIAEYGAQKTKMCALLLQRLKKGDTWYLVDIRWMKQWKKYVGFDQWDQSSAGLESANPGPVDNLNLFKDGPDKLKEHLMEELDYYLLPTAAWDLLLSWYGLSEGSHPISRNVVEHGLYMKHCKVEVYLLEFGLCTYSDERHVVKGNFSKASTVAELELEMKQIFSIAKNVECRVWHRYMTNTYELLGKPSQTLQDAGLYNAQLVVLEERNKDETWPRSLYMKQGANSSR